MTLAAGMRLGPYEILAPLGAGGMGEVYRARDTRLAREVAIKVLPAGLAADSGRLQRFEKEARSASALNHPNIVTIHDIGSEGGVSYIAMERVEGPTLRELLATGPLPIRKFFQIAPQIAEGLSKAHEAGIVHRDLKPENVMVTKDGLVKILDFGLAKLTSTMSGSDEGSHLPTMTGTTPGTVVGTVGYMSPEQASGEGLDFRSDQFSLGSILYEMATGRRAFQKKTAIDTLAAILNEEPEAIAAVSPQTPAPLRWIVERCLSKEPDERYASTKDLARELSTVRDHLSEAVSGPSAVAADPRAKKRLRLALPLAAVLAAGILAGKLLWKTPAPTQPNYQRLTYGNGFVDSARFSPDGSTIVYSAYWDGQPSHLFLTRPEAPQSQRLDLPDASLMSISSTAELAVISSKIKLIIPFWYGDGTLATVPLAGGTPREISEGVRFADWAPDGKRMLIVRGDQLEYPPGKVIHRGSVVLPRFSPSGDRIAFVEDQRVHVVDLSGKELRASRDPEFIQSLAWNASGEEVWFTTAEGGFSSLKAMTPTGAERVLLRSPRVMILQDVSRDGRRVLVSFDARRSDVWVGSFGETRERRFTVFGGTNAMGISADGKALLDDEMDSFFLLRTDGPPPKKLGEGFGSELSPDGKWAAVVRPGPSTQLVLVPTGAGEERPLERGPIEKHYPTDIRWSGNGKRLLFGASEKNHKERLYLQDVEGGRPRPLTPDGLHTESSSISNDGRFVLVEEDGYWIYSADGGAKRPVAGLRKGVDFVWRNWSEDGRYVYAWDPTELPFRVSRIELSTGKREPWKTIAPQDPVGIITSDLMIANDGKSYAYNCGRQLSDLYLVEGLR